MVTLTELTEAYLRCRRTKRGSQSALDFEVELERNLCELHAELVGGSYRIGRLKAFVVRQPVLREVFAAPFRDRVVHHWLMGRLEPLLDRELIRDCYACRPGKGTAYGVKRVRRMIGKVSQGYSQRAYVLQCDIRGYFRHIDRRKLWALLHAFLEQRKEQIADYGLVARMAEQIALHDPTQGCWRKGGVGAWRGLPEDKSLFGKIDAQQRKNRARQGGAVQLELDFEGGSDPCGLPIGNLTSQWFANFYLNGFDHWIKHTLGIRHYGRYVDDFVVVDSDRGYLEELLPRIGAFLREELGLELHPDKCKIRDCSQGVDFLGVRLRGGAVLVGKRSKDGAYRAVHQINEQAARKRPSQAELGRWRATMNAYLGLMRWQSSYGLRRKLVRSIAPQVAKRLQYRGYTKVALRYGANGGKRGGRKVVRQNKHKKIKR